MLGFYIDKKGVSMSLLFLTAASAVPLTYFPLVTRAVSLHLLISLIVKYFVEGCRGVKVLLWRDEWLMAVDRCLNGVRTRTKRVRNASIKYETLRASGEFSGEDFQNKGTFIVVRSSVFVVSSAQITHLARDAYHAYS